MVDLLATLGTDNVRWNEVDRALYSGDASLLRGDTSAICFPRSTADVQAAVRIARSHGRPIVARGAGTGLAGGAVPLHGALVVVTTRMDRILEIDLDARAAWVEPGVVNLDLTRALRPRGWHFAPDPSSQQACSIGGNVATNSGGPHCLASGVTSAHTLAIDVVLPDGMLVTLGGLDPEPVGLDLRGAFVGSEGTFGIATRIAVRLTRVPRAVRTMLIDFSSIESAATTVGAVIADGIVPAALEMMDGPMTRAAEDFVGAGYPRDAAAVLLVEVDGLDALVERQAVRIAEIARSMGCRTVRLAADDAERELLWKGRKTAFGAVARIKPNYYLHDTVIPRRTLPDVLATIAGIAADHDLQIMNVFHAGDGNLHPLIVFDGREPGILDRVHAAGDEIVRASLAVGGVLSGEHGIGLEKRDYMSLQFGAADLDAQERLRHAFDPDRVCNPDKILPSGARCRDIASLPTGVWV